MWLWHGHVIFKSSIFVAQKATAPKNGVEFRQGSIGKIKSSLATSYEVWWRYQFLTNQRPRNYLIYTHRQTQNQHTVRTCSMSSACKNLHSDTFFRHGNFCCFASATQYSIFLFIYNFAAIHQIINNSRA